MTPPESHPGTLPKIVPTTLTYDSFAFGTLWVRGLTAGDMFRVAERFPELASADDDAVMRTVAANCVTRDSAGEKPLPESEFTQLDATDYSAIASLMCQIDEVDQPHGSDPIGVYVSFVKQEVLKVAERGKALWKSIGSSILSPGTISRMAQSYAGGALSDRFIGKASARASQLSALEAPLRNFPVDRRPERMESIAQDTLEAHLQILRRLSDIADVAADVQADRAAQQYKDSRNLKIAMASLILSVVFSLVTIWVSYVGVRKADAATAESGTQYQQMIDLQRQQRDEVKSLSTGLQEQLIALRTEMRSAQPSEGTSKPGAPTQPPAQARKHLSSD